MSYNVSARPLTITVQSESDRVEIKELPGDASPIEIVPIMYGDPVMDVNGNLLVKRKFVPLKITISVIPGSESEKKMGKIVYDEFVNGKSIPVDIMTSNESMTTFVTGGNENVKPDSFIGCRLIGATIGYTVSKEGAFETKKYHFVCKHGNQG